MTFKKTTAAVILGLALTTNSAQAGNLAEPLVSPEVIEAETTASSGFIIPLVILAVLVALISSGGGSSSSGGGLAAKVPPTF